VSKQRIESLPIFNTLLQGGLPFGEGTVVKHTTEGWGRAFRSNAPRHDLTLVVGLGAGEGAGNFASVCLALPRWLSSRIVDMPALATGEPNFAGHLDVDWIL